MLSHRPMFSMPTFDHYTSLWNRWGMFFDGLFNSTIVTAGATALAVSASTCAGYVYCAIPAVSQCQCPVPHYRSSDPADRRNAAAFPIVNAIGLNDTHIVLIVLYATFFVSLGAILMRTFYRSRFPANWTSGGVDGAKPLTILWRVIVPLAAPGILAVAVFVVVFSWNEFLFAFIFTATKAKTTPLVISEMIGSIDGVDWGILFAASTVQLPPFFSSLCS